MALRLTYEELKSDIDRMRHGEENVLWPGQVKWFAKVSAETKAYQPIPVIADFTNENGSDSLRETIEANYRKSRKRCYPS